jgi:hypothetical protein
MTDGIPSTSRRPTGAARCASGPRCTSTVAPYRPQLACPERSLATVEALHGFLTEALAAESVPDPAAVAHGLLLQALDKAAIPE